MSNVDRLIPFKDNYFLKKKDFLNLYRININVKENRKNQFVLTAVNGSIG